jgi:hypothetical protein
MKCIKCGKHYPDYEFEESGMCSRCHYGIGANLPGEKEFLKKMGNNILSPNEERLAQDYEETMISYAELDKNNPALDAFRKKKVIKNEM